MIGPQVDLADVLRMLRECAQGFESRITRHWLQIRCDGKIAILPKGPGIPRSATLERLRGVMIHARIVRKIVQDLNLKTDCVARHFPAR